MVQTSVPKWTPPLPPPPPLPGTGIWTTVYGPDVRLTWSPPADVTNVSGYRVFSNTTGFPVGSAGTPVGADIPVGTHQLAHATGVASPIEVR
jgi:hypothetical protein